MEKAKSLLEVVECIIKTSIKDLALFLAFHQGMPGMTPPVFEYNNKVYVPIGLSLNQPCLLEAEIEESEADKHYLHVLVKRDGIEYKFSNTPPESMDVKVYPIIHITL